MPTTTPTIGKAKPSVDGKWLYNLLMSEIEPDLVLETIPLLKERYAGETPEEHAKRERRYAKAFEVFDSIAADLDQNLSEDLQAQKKSVREQVKLKESSEHEEELKQVEESIQSLTEDHD
ncbi:hypothetical protein COU80_00765 [Candidatus Peregrinibacteria bacterium CG10_big_fil_rev_8_21_14_0_10_55_24]|nr:MAG: hypothetical protein COU80_00765 [Candidatus Peregrinibacteria bacterium CG10_big_fil_rev_8_21_14_0_10_55_24]